MQGENMKGALLIIICLLTALTAPAAFAGNIIEFGFWIDDKDKAKLDDVRVVPGEEDQVNLFESDYSIEVYKGKVEYMTYFPVRYEILTDPPRQVDRVFIVRKLPYIGNKGQVNIYRYNNLLLTFDLSQLCIKNGKCEDFENYLTCEDCRADNPDYICVAEKNDICDPDCNYGADPDCAIEEGTEISQTSMIPHYTVFILIVAGLLAYVILRVRKTSRRSQQKSAGKRLSRP